MQLMKPVWDSPQDHLRASLPDEPVAYFAPSVLRETARRFRAGFPGLVTYAVKANPSEAVLANLSGCGIGAFDVASPVEMALVRRVAPGAVLHYNNPVRSPAEIAAARDCGVASYSVDCRGELDKLAAHLPDRRAEVAVRFKLPIDGATYDFGEKFGAAPQMAAGLLRRVAALGFVPALAFHPGTQCHDAAVWRAYIEAAAAIAGQAGVAVARLNVGGGFASHRLRGEPPSHGPVFAAIRETAQRAFAAAGLRAPALLCEPGRAMVGDACALATRVKALRDDGAVFLNDGIYGGLAEHPVIGPIDRVQVITADGRAPGAETRARVVFGPTCDSIDKLPEPVVLPADLAEGDYVLFHGLGAYATALATRFNGYGVERMETVASLAF